MSLNTMRLRWNECLEHYPKLSSAFAFLRRALLRFHLRGVEYMLAFLAVVTGFWVGWPWQNLYESETQLYRVFADYMPAWLWTIAFLVPALPSIFLNNKKRWQVVLRIVGMGCLLSVWVLASLLFIVDRSPFLATAWTPVFAFYQGWAMLNAWLRFEARETYICESCPSQSS